MKKDYQKPEVELIALAATEAVTDSVVDASIGLGEAPDTWD